MAYYDLKSEISENQIDKDISSYITWCTPTNTTPPYLLLDINESITGADALFDVGACIYLQYKKADGLTKWDFPKLRKNASKKQSIREFRSKQKLNDTPSLFFQLRRKANGASDLQHNVLLAHHKPPTQHAIYVAPTFLSFSAYRKALFHSALVGSVFKYCRVQIHGNLSFLKVPFLNAHVSIPPHIRVNHHDHYYAFSTSGDDISWHSGEVIEQRFSRLSDYLSNFFSETLFSENGRLPLDRLAEQIPLDFYPQEIFPWSGDASPLEKLSAHGRWLRKKYSIQQFILLASRERLSI